jgi:hypothetical protein
MEAAVRNSAVQMCSMLFEFCNQDLMMPGFRPEVVVQPFLIAMQGEVLSQIADSGRTALPQKSRFSLTQKVQVRLLNFCFVKGVEQFFRGRYLGELLLLTLGTHLLIQITVLQIESFTQTCLLVNFAFKRRNLSEIAKIMVSWSSC